MQKNIAIIGAGLVGSLFAVILSRKGHKVSVYERRSDMRKEEMAAGRSINLALSDRGWKALEIAGITDRIRKVAIPMKGRMIHDVEGGMTFQSYGKDDQAIYSVSRAELNCVLMDIAEKDFGVDIHFNHRCDNIDLHKGKVIFTNEKGEEKTVEADHIFGSDGAFSAVRLNMMLQRDLFNYQQFYIDHGYKELNIPAAEGGGFLIEKNALHIWPRGQFMLIALPNEDGSFTCTLFFPFEGEHSFASLNSKEKVKSFFESVFPDAVKLMPSLIEDYTINPTSSLVTVKCFPWAFEDKFCLIGDAAHAVVPFYGQGMNCGFEDCSVFYEMMDDFGDDWGKLFDAFQKSRKVNADAIADLAIQNFIEMRDKVANPMFLLRKKIEAKFSMDHPGKWMPLYSMVTFSHLPYSHALEAGNRQEKIMDEVMNLPEIVQKWDSDEVQRLILSRL